MQLTASESTGTDAMLALVAATWLQLITLAASSLSGSDAGPSGGPPPNEPMIMVGIANGGNPGETPPATSFDDPSRLASRGFNAVTILNHELCANFSVMSPLVR
jgi:hypothetical protein